METCTCLKKINKDNNNHLCYNERNRWKKSILITTYDQSLISHPCLQGKEHQAGRLCYWILGISFCCISLVGQLYEASMLLASPYPLHTFSRRTVNQKKKKKLVIQQCYYNNCNRQIWQPTRKFQSKSHVRIQFYLGIRKTKVQK